MSVAFECADCRVDTLVINEYYMVRNDIWRSVVPHVTRKHRGVTYEDDGHTMLCIACLEQRLGRMLMPQDFPMEIPVNQMPHSHRLEVRMGRA